QVTAIPLGRATGSSTTSDQTGQFTLNLEPGKYTLRINAKDFLETSGIVDVGNSPEPRDYVLRLAGVSQSVDVTEAPSYRIPAISSATKTLTPLRDVPQSITIVTEELMKDQGMMSVADVMRYVPGIQVHQGENNRDQVIIRGNSTSADFFVNGVRDDVQYYR